MMPWLSELDRVDRGLYRAVARARTPRLDSAMRRLSHAANYSRLSLAAAGLLALSGSRGRRAACAGLPALALAATLANVALKPLGRRRRPDRVGARVPFARHVRMPASTSFPSGHTAAAVAFAAGAGRVLPPVRIPLYALAGAVGYSRVHTGVHYPGDVLGGAALGVLAAKLTARVCPRREDVQEPQAPPP